VNHGRRRAGERPLGMACAGRIGPFTSKWSARANRCGSRPVQPTSLSQPDEQLRAADKGYISYSDFVTRLVPAQWQAKQEGALEWRIRRANLPERCTLETFPFARQPGVNRKQIRGFAELEFIAKAENIVLVGKTDLATFCTPSPRH